MAGVSTAVLQGCKAGQATTTTGWEPQRPWQVKASSALPQPQLVRTWSQHRVSWRMMMVALMLMLMLLFHLRLSLPPTTQVRRKQSKTIKDAIRSTGCS